MFGLFRSNKEKAAAKKLEKADSFYQTNSMDEDDDLKMGHPSEMNDDEYRRRVTEEIAKRKSPGKPIPVVAKSSPISKPTTPAKSPVTNFSPVGRAPAPAVSAKSGAATPSRSPAAVPVKQTTPSSSAKPSAVSTPGSRPGTAPSTPAAVASAVSASRPNSATTAPLTRSNNIAASKPSSAGNTPNATTTKTGFFSADTKAVQQLVTMGFSYPASTLALMKNNNKIDLAAEFLLERSDDEINQLLALESASMANASKKSTPAASPAPSPAASPLKRAVSTNKAAAARALFIQTQNLNSRSGPPSMESPQPTKSPPVQLSKAPSQRVTKGKDATAVDSAMAAILAKREALKKADNERSSKNASPAVPESPAADAAVASAAAATPSPSKPSPFERMSSYKTKGQILRDEKDEENRRQVEAQEARRKALRELSLASSPGAGVTTTTTGGTPVLENRAFEALHMKKTHSMVLAEEAEQAKKAEVEAQEKRRKSLTQSDSSLGPAATKQSDKSGDSCGDSVVTTNTSNTAFDSLYSKKTRAMLVAEAVERMQREQQEAHEAEIHAQAMRRKLLRDASPGGTRTRTSSVDSVSVITTSTLNKSGAFENLHLTKTRSMLMAEAADESQRVEKEAQDRKWKKATTPRSSISEGYLTTENEVFDKLHSKKRVNQEIREQVTFEEKAHLEKREAHMLGKAGANLPALDDSKLLHRTKSAFMREQLKEEERQRSEEARATHAAKRMDSFSRAASIKSFRSPSSADDEANRRNLVSNSEDTLTESDSSVNRSIRRGKSSGQLVPSTAASNMLDGIGATMVDDFSDIEEEDEEEEDEDDDRMPTLDVNERSPVKRTAPTQTITHKNSDFFKFGQSFYANDSKSSFRAKQSFRRSEGGLLSNNNSSRNLLEMKVEDIRGQVRRTSMPFEVYETSDHTWAGKVTLPANPITTTIETVVTLRGTYPTREQCVSITSAYAPPVWVEAQKNSTCRVCEEAFNKYLKVEHCNNCGQLVCMDCSDESWPATMFPYTFVERKTKPRACSACTHLMEKLVAALKAGDLDQVTALVETGNVNLHFPFSVYPDAPYPIHCAAASGNVALLEWLVQKQHCLTKDVRTGELLTTAAGHTLLAVAARKGDTTMMRYLLHSLDSSVLELTDVAVLQRGLHAALEAPGGLPTIGHKRPPRSPMISPNSSFSRYEKPSPRREEAASAAAAAAVDTSSLHAKASELAEKLKAAQHSTRELPASDAVSPSTVAATLVTPPEEAEAAAAAAQTDAKPESPAVVVETKEDGSVGKPSPARESIGGAGNLTVDVQVPSVEEKGNEAPKTPPRISPRNNPTSPLSLLSRSSSQETLSANHRGTPLRTVSAGNVLAAVSPRAAAHHQRNASAGAVLSFVLGESNHSQSFTDGTKRMNSTKIEPPQDASPKSRMTLPRSPSNTNHAHNVHAEIQAGAQPVAAHN